MGQDWREGGRRQKEPETILTLPEQTHCTEGNDTGLDRKGEDEEKGQSVPWPYHYRLTAQIVMVLCSLVILTIY